MPQPPSRWQSIVAFVRPAWRSRLSAPQRLGAWALYGAAVALHVAAYPFIVESAGVAAAAVYILPALVAGWYFGVPGALIAAVGFPVVHAALSHWGGLLVTQGTQNAIGVGGALAIGGVVGRARDLREALVERTVELMQSEERCRLLVESSPEGVLVHAQGVLLYANPAFTRMLGEPAGATLAGRTLVNLVPFEDREAMQRHFVTPVPDLGQTLRVEARFLRADGSTAVADLTSVPVVYGGTPARLVLVRDPRLRAPAAAAAPEARAVVAAMA